MEETDEHPFNIDELLNFDDINDILSDPDVNKMLETPSFLPPSSSSSGQQDNPIEIDGSYQVDTPTSGANFSMSRNPENTFGYGSVGGPSNYPVGDCIPNTSRSRVSQVDQRHLSNNHYYAQLAGRTTNYAPSPFQRQQQQRPLRNPSSSFAMTNQESRGIGAQQRLDELQQISQQWQMQNALNVQNQFPQYQNIALAQPMKSGNDPRQFVQVPPQGRHLEAPRDSSFQVQMENPGVWIEHAIYQVRSLKNDHYEQLVIFYDRVKKLRNQTRDPKMMAQCDHAMLLCKRTDKFFHISRGDIFCDGKEIFARGLNCLRQSLSRIKTMNTHLNQFAPLSSSQLETDQLQQRGSVPRGSLEVGSSSGVENYDWSSLGVPRQSSMSDLDIIVASCQNTNYSSDSCISPVTQNSLKINSESNNHSNVIKPAEPLMSERPVQKSNESSSMRQFTTFNKSSSFEVLSPQLMAEFSGTPAQPGPQLKDLNQSNAVLDTKMKRQMDSSRTEMEGSANDMVKRSRKQTSHQLLQEVDGINQKLSEVVIEARAGSDEGMSIIRCSYQPIEHHGNNSSSDTSLLKFLVLELTVSADYPHSSPVIVETEPTCCSLSEEGKDMWKKAMSNFSAALTKSAQPVLLEEMAKTWEGCAGEVYRQFAQSNDGLDFSFMGNLWC